MNNRDTELIWEAYNSSLGDSKVTPSQLLDLIKSLPGAEYHITKDDTPDTVEKYGGEWWVTAEWLGIGRAFVGKTPEEAAQKQIEYLDRHHGHNSIAGNAVDKSG